MRVIKQQAGKNNSTHNLLRYNQLIFKIVTSEIEKLNYGSYCRYRFT